MAHGTAAANIALLVCMILIFQFSNLEFSRYNNEGFAEINGTCRRWNRTIEKTNGIINLLTKGHVLRFSLGVVGGMLGQVVEYRNILWYGGALMSISSCLAISVAKLGLICRPEFYYISWILYPLYNGLLLPVMFRSFVRWSQGPKSRMLLMLLYYLVSQLFFILDSTFGLKVGVPNEEANPLVSVIAVCLSLTFTALSSKLRGEPGLLGPSEIEQMTVSRLMRYVRILAAFTVFVAQVNDGHVTDYRYEIRYLAGTSNHSEPEPSLWQLWAEKANLTRNANTAGIFAAACSLVVMAAAPCIRLPSHQHRIMLGVATAAAASLSCLTAYLVLGNAAGSWKPAAAYSVFGTAAFLDGISEFLSTVALFEFLDAISARQHKLWLVGITFTACALSGVLRKFIGIAVIRIASGGARIGENDWDTVARLDHAIDFVLSAACLAYARWLSFPLAFPLLQDRWQDAEQQEADRALLTTEQTD